MGGLFEGAARLSGEDFVRRSLERYSLFSYYLVICSVSVSRFSRHRGLAFLLVSRLVITHFPLRRFVAPRTDGSDSLGEPDRAIFRADLRADARVTRKPAHEPVRPVLPSTRSSLPSRMRSPIPRNRHGYRDLQQVDRRHRCENVREVIAVRRAAEPAGENACSFACLWGAGPSSIRRPRSPMRSVPPAPIEIGR